MVKNIKLDDNKAKITEFTILHQKNKKNFVLFLQQHWY